MALRSRARALRLLELGDDAATALGLRVERAPASRSSCSRVALVAVTSTAIGPDRFVALTAPQIARRLTRTAEPALLAVGAHGRAHLLASPTSWPSASCPDAAARRGRDRGGRRPVPVWLLCREWR